MTHEDFKLVLWLAGHVVLKRETDTEHYPSNAELRQLAPEIKKLARDKHFAVPQGQGWHAQAWLKAFQLWVIEERTVPRRRRVP